MALVRVLSAFIIAGALWALAGSAAQAQGLHFHAVLVGGNEVAGGDVDGFGTAAAHFRSSTQICVAIIVSKIATPTAAHIHEGFAPTNGPVVIPLTAPAAGNPGGAFGCAAVTSALYNAIRSNPTKFYVNVHTADFPGGAIRGQLF